MRTCIFCSNPADSLEHVVGEWLSKAMQMREMTVLPTLILDDRVSEQRPPIKFEHLRTKIVCGSCNNGWMSDLEAKFKNAHVNLVSPGVFDETAAASELIHANYDHLTRWMVKTALVLERAAPKNTNQIVPETMLRIRDMTLGDHRLYVYAAMSMEPGFHFQLTKGFRGQNGSKFLKNMNHKDSFRFSTQLNNLLLSVVHCPEARGGFESPLTIMGRVMAPIISGVSLGIFRPAMHIFPNFETFCRSIFVIADNPVECGQSLNGS